MRIGALLRSNRCTLVGALVVGVAIPELLHPLFAPGLDWFGLVWPLELGLVAAVVALIAAHFILRRVGLIPLVDDKLLILPTFVTSFGVVTLLLTLPLGPYGYYHLVTAFGGGMAWYFAVAIMRARYSHPRLAYVGDTVLSDDLLASRIEWAALRRPVLPSKVMGLVFDSAQDVSPQWERLFARAVLRNIPVYDLGRLSEMITGRVQLRERPELVFGQLLPSQPYLRIKRVIDTVTVIPALVFAVPVIALAALAIRLESPGKALFVQRRVGFRGKTFDCYKLRSMRTDMRGAAYTLEDDPRVTRVGRFIRQWRIDELPQLFNILRGDMSWIGPRPEAVSLSRTYRRDIPYYEYRHAVRPGISGWAAVHQGNVALVHAVTRKLEYDFYYIKYFSIWLDFLITLMTIRTVVTGFGSR